MEDEALIARASSGLALRGIYVGGASELIGTKSAVKILLRPPRECKIKAPEQPFRMETLCFSSIQASERFSNIVHKSGWSVAVNASTDKIFSIGVTASAGGGISNKREMKSANVRKSSEGCYLQCWYIPKAAFSLSRNQMQLTEEALDDMRRICTVDQAKSFVRDYNSHVATGTYHLGGTLMKGVTMKSDSEMSCQSMLEKVTAKANAEAEVSYLGAKAGMKFVYLNDESSSSSSTSNRQQAMVIAVHKAFGPSTDDEAEFQKRLEDRSTWYIIDMTSDRAGELVPVWEIPSVTNHVALSRACRLLQKAWQNTVESVNPRNGQLYDMLQESYMSSVPQPALAPPDCKRRRELERLLELCLNVSETKTPGETSQALSNLWVKASKNTPHDQDIYASWSDRVWLFKHPKFLTFVSGIAESSVDSLHTSALRALVVQGILTADMKKALTAAGVFLPASIRDLSTKTKEVIDRLPTLEHLSATQLLARLKELVSSETKSSLDQLNMTVEPAVRACLRGPNSQVVKNIVMQHGFDESGYFSGRSLDKDKVQIIIQDLSDQFETPTPGPVSPRHQEPDIISVLTVPKYSTSPRNEYTYSGGFLVDRPSTASCEDPCTRMLDCIRHRIHPFKEILDTYNQSNNSELERLDDDMDDILFGSDTDIDEGADSELIGRTDSSCHSLGLSPLDTLVRLLVRSDILAQISIFQVLLEERFAIPVIVPLDRGSTSVEGSTEFGHLVEALGFVKVKLANQETLSVAGDSKLLRVVFVSNREVVSQRQITEMACDVMNCQFPNYRCTVASSHDQAVVMELGVGFVLHEGGPAMVVNQAAVATKEKSEKHMPCLVFCVSGDHNKLGNVLEKLADVVVVETEPDAQPSFPSWATQQMTLSWSTDSRRRPGQKASRKLFQVWGSFNQVSQAISKFLVKPSLRQHRRDDRAAAPLEECFTSVASLKPKTTISNAVAKLEPHHFEKARSSFSLQKSYSEEAQWYFEALKYQGKKAMNDRKIKNCREIRATEAKRILQLPILQLFLKLLSEGDPVKRNIGIWHLQLTIDVKLHATLEKAARKENDAFDTYQRNLASTDMKKDYYTAKEEHVNQMLGLEHLWRELSHIFVADPKNTRHLPKLAALHLMDGFPLEILDGDAGTFHEPWVNSVLVELDGVLQGILKRKPKVFVLSVVGLQSSGKSTLLNVMFGAKLKASAGMCTRGVFLQLVKAEWPDQEADFDYVLILDTMGLKAPEYFGREGVVAQDNRIATFAVLPADACVVMVANEEDNGLKEVLPMVMLAFRGSALAEKASGRLKAKLFFVYRSVDQNDIKKLKNNQRKLTVDLQDASRAVGRLNVAGSGASTSQLLDGVSPLHDFQINPEDENHSDVKYFGNLKKDTTPPDDVPVWEYGSKVEELREYIHRRVVRGGRWKAHELVKWKDYLGMVWKTIADANFELSFVNHLEHANFQEIQTRLANCRQKLGKKWQDEFESLTGAEGLTPVTQPEQPSQLWYRLWTTLTSQVAGTVATVEKEVQEILEVEQFQNWKVDESNGWIRFCEENESHWKEQLRNWTDGVLGFENLLRDYTTRMEVTMSSHWSGREYDLEKANEATMKSEFDSIFKRVLLDAARDHPALAVKVKGMIHEKYVNNSLVGGKFKFDSCSDLGKSSNNQSLLSTLASKVTLALKPAFFRNDNASAEDVLREKLTRRLESCLQDTKQYSAYIVDHMIQFTEESLGSSKALGQSMHNLVKARLTDEMTRIQRDWDARHNVSTKLENQREYFWQCFMSHARKETGTKMLTLALCNALRQDNLEAAFTALVTRMVASKLLGEHWVCDWVVMRAYLDLHLIELIESGRGREVVDIVSDGKAHYTILMNKLIARQIENQLQSEGDLWARVRDKIRDAMSTAAVAAGRPPKPGQEKHQIFQQSIINSLSPLSKELAKSVSINVSQDVCRLAGNAIDFYEIRDQVSTEIGKIQISMAPLQVVVDHVRKRMAESNTDRARPRCDAMCPRCGLTCFMALNHAGKHHTLHQPEGLQGVRDSHSHELSAESCSESVKMDCLMKGRGLPDHFVPYRDFETYFPDWTLPCEGLGTVEVREYIFAHFQNELVQKFDDTVPCTAIPHEFRRSLRGLRLKLSNEIQSKTGQPYSSP